MAILNGTFGMIAVGGDVIANLTSVDITKSVATIDISSKTSGGNRELIAGQFSFSGSASGFFEDGAGAGTDTYEHLVSLMQAKTAVTLLYTEYDATGTTAATGKENYTGSIIITELSRTDGLEEAATFDISFEGTGALSTGTNP